MCPERRIFFLGALWRGVGRRAGIRASVRPCVRACVRPGRAPFLHPQNAIKQFKINGLGVFLDPPLARLWARTCFLTPSLLAQHGPKKSIKIVVKPMEFCMFCSSGSFLRSPPARPSCPKMLKTRWFYNMFDTFLGPMLSHQWRVNKNTSWPISAPKGRPGKRPNNLF